MEPAKGGHLWTESFIRLISHSNDEKRLRALQQIILHTQGKGDKITASPKRPSPPRKVVKKKAIIKKKKSESDLITSVSDEKWPIIQKFSNFKTSVSPIMGKWALLTRYHILKPNKDAEIVTRMVTEKFKSIYTKHKKKFGAGQEENCENEDNDKEAKVHPDKESESESKENELYQRFSLFCDNELFSSVDNNFASTIDETLFRTALSDGFPDRPEEGSECGSETHYEDLDSTASLNEKKSEMEEAEDAFKDKLQYDANKFLQAALGNEMFDSSSVISSENEISRDYNPRPYDDSSVSTAQISSLYKASLYLQRLYSGTIDSVVEPSPTGSYEFFGDAPISSKISALVQDAAAQNQIILQTCKALSFCESSKNFKGSVEYVEAEKILLLATLRYEAAKKELKKLDQQELRDSGTVTISNVSFPVEEKNDQRRWCLVAASCGSHVLSTDLVELAHPVTGPNRTFTFEKLEVDFEITIGIYVLGAGSCEFHTKQETALCPAPNKLFTKARKSPTYEKRGSSFVLWASTSIQLADLTKSAFKLAKRANESSLKGYVNLDVESEVVLNSAHSGFLTIGSEAKSFVVWNRYWCVLDGHFLKYWNYPAETELAEPIGSIDLRYCVGSRIMQVDRELCARPRTLLLETGRMATPRDRNSLLVECTPACTITRHYFSADSNAEMNAWQKNVNSLVSTLRNWNCMKCQLYFSS